MTGEFMTGTSGTPISLMQTDANREPLKKRWFVEVFMFTERPAGQVVYPRTGCLSLPQC